jgi:ankyrin repeat protein
MALALGASVAYAQLQSACNECRWDDASSLLNAYCFDQFLANRVRIQHDFSVRLTCIPKQESGCTALYVAAANGGTDAVAKMLAQKGFRRLLNAVSSVDRSKNWGTPLHAACKEDHADIVELLLLAGARQDIMDDVCFSLCVCNLVTLLTPVPVGRGVTAALGCRVPLSPKPRASAALWRRRFS